MQNYFILLCFKLFVVFSLPVTAYHTAHIEKQKRNCWKDSEISLMQCHSSELAVRNDVSDAARLVHIRHTV